MTTAIIVSSHDMIEVLYTVLVLMNMMGTRGVRRGGQQVGYINMCVLP